MVAAAKVQARQQQLDISTAAMDSMRKENVFTDVVLVCGDWELPAHRVVLGGGSPYFRTMFESTMVEAVTGKVELRTLDCDAIATIVDFIYTGHIRDIENDIDLLRAVLEASHMLQVQVLFDYCIQTLMSKVSVDYFLEPCLVAELYNEEQLLNEIHSLIVGNFSRVSRTVDFHQLSIVQLQQILMHSKVSHVPLDDVVGGLLEWTKADLDNRTQDLSDMMSSLDLNLLSAKYIKELLSDEPLVDQNPGLYESLITASLQYIASDSLEKEEMVLNTSLICFGKDGDRSLMSAFNMEAGSWTAAKVLPFPLTDGMTAEAYDGHIYFFGCENSHKEATTTVIKYSPFANSATSSRSLKFPVFDAGAGEFQGQIYVVGGWNKYGKDVKTVQRFNPILSVSEQVASTNVDHLHPFVLPMCGFLYIGGLRDNVVERYDPHADQWTSITAIPGGVWGCSGAFWEGKLYVVRMWDNPTPLSAYDPVTNRWEERRCRGNAPRGVRGMWAVNHPERERPVLLVHGEKKNFYSLDPRNDLWKKLGASSCPFKRNFILGVVMEKTTQ